MRPRDAATHYEADFACELHDYLAEKFFALRLESHTIFSVPTSNNVLVGLVVNL